MNVQSGSHLAFALALTLCAPAFAKPAQDLGSIKRELWVTEAGVESAAADLLGLRALAGDSQAYEPKLATQLRDRAARRLIEGEHHLSQLWRVPGQDDATLRLVASLQDAVRKARERVQKLGQATRAQVEPRPDTRRGASDATQGGAGLAAPAPRPDPAAMPPSGSEGMLDVRAELKAVSDQLEVVEDQARKLTQHYGIADELPAP